MSGWGSTKTILSILGILLIVFVALAIGERGYNLSKLVSGTKPDNVISVSGTGKVKAVPDVATVSLGVVAQGKDAKEAQNLASDRINKITSFVKGLGVAKEDITTSSANLNPRYDYQNGRNDIVGYDSNQTITVKVRGVDKSNETVGKILAGAVDNGANQVYGSQFTIDDPDSLKQEARKLAIEKAKVKARELAEAAGIKLGKVVSVQDGEGSYTVPPIAYATDKGYGIGGGGAEAIAPSVEPGSQDISQTVTLVFEVK